MCKIIQFPTKYAPTARPASRWERFKAWWIKFSDDAVWEGRQY